MNKFFAITTLLIAILFSCNQPTPNHLLKTNNLASEFFEIDTRKDTSLYTKNGARIKIPKGALKAATSIVQLEIKEAYSIEDMVLAGLTTQSNGQPLSSGGMIYINAAGATVTQALSVAVPSSFIEKNMQLFKGEIQRDSTINWTDPQPLPSNPQLTALDRGNILFQENCAACHYLGKLLTGPDLAHITKFYPYNNEFGKDHLYGFTRDPAKLVRMNPYYACLRAKFGGVVMTSFPDLTNADLDNLYAYIENESNRRNLPIPDTSLPGCLDSCELYFAAKTRWEEVIAELKKDSVNMVVANNLPASSFPMRAPVNPPRDTSDLINVVPNKTLYYQFTVDTFGWFNLDILLKNIPGVINSELSVRITGRYRERFNIFLVIPSHKVFAPGGLLKNGQDSYGFYSTDGTLPLPQNTRASIIAMGEYEDTIIFAKKEFLTQQKQTFTLELATVSKEQFRQEIALTGMSMEVKDTKIAAELRKAVKELKNAEQLKPKNCDCNCLMQNESGDYGWDYLALPLQPTSK